ncbi:amino acid ABC transporter substrate-binding protein [Seminibacterium arietis]|uniref:Amino acid ABC transporter substrate-binding protein n=1 Tax=Seminibacterium arietis TaxID=1173502 RepID=A0ABW3I9S9_9PAST
MLKKIIFLTLSITSLLVTNNATANNLLERINTKGVIIVGTEGTYAPFTYHNSEGKLTGYDVEVARAVAKKLGIKIEFKETQWDAMLAGLKSGRFDLVANQVALTTPERQVTFDKSEPYSWSGAMLVARDNENRIQKIEDIKGLRAAQTLSSNYGELAIHYSAEVIPIDNMAQGLLLIQQNRADTTFNDSLALLDYLKKHPNSGLRPFWEADTKIGAGFIVNKGNNDALDKINTALIELRNEGVLKKLGEQFFGRDVSVK